MELCAKETFRAHSISALNVSYGVTNVLKHSMIVTKTKILVHFYKKFQDIVMTLAVFHDFLGLENGLTKFHDFPGRVVTLYITAPYSQLNVLLHVVTETKVT